MCNFVCETMSHATVMPAKSDSDNILFIIVKYNINLYTPLELTLIDCSIVY